MSTTIARSAAVRELLDYLMDSPPQTAQQIAEHFGISHRQAQRRISDLHLALEGPVRVVSVPQGAREPWLYKLVDTRTAEGLEEVRRAHERGLKPLLTRANNSVKYARLGLRLAEASGNEASIRRARLQLAAALQQVGEIDQMIAAIEA